jgi:hypothetical protein
MDAVLLAQQSWIRAFDSKFKICSKKLINFRICYKALKNSPDYNSKSHIDQTRAGVHNISGAYSVLTAAAKNATLAAMEQP